MSKLEKKPVLLVTGGTGTFGNAVISRLIKRGYPCEIRVFSRDEKKQHDMRQTYANRPSHIDLEFFIGDVRDKESIVPAMKGVEHVFHAAALKQVPSCEFFPIEAVKTNVLGADNVMSVAENHGVEKVVILSTDKAVYPINAMGMSKALMEKSMVARARNSTTTEFCGTRYGNVIASRGSVVELFYEQIKEGRNLTITNPNMTRFLMSIEDAVDLVFHAFDYGGNGDMHVLKSPAATIETIAHAMRKIFEVEDQLGIEIIGTRHGEKMYESLITREELAKAYEDGQFYVIPSDKRSMDYKSYYTKGELKVPDQDYNSDNTKRLSVDEVVKLLSGLDFIKSALTNYERNVIHGSLRS